MSQLQCNNVVRRAKKNKETRINTQHLHFAANKGKSPLCSNPQFKDTHEPLKRLLDYTQPATSTFRDLIRVYNGMFCFTSFGAQIDHSINKGMCLYTFCINGQNYHRIGSLLPTAVTQPRYAQLWFFDTHNEVRNRLVDSLIRMLDANSAIAKAFRMTQDWCHADAIVNVEFRLLSERTSSKQYNAPTVAEVAALITNDFGDGEPTRDIVVCQKDSPPKRISELHPSYMALQYPLPFPYGEDSYHEQISYHTNKGKRKTTRDYVTMKEYYAYVIQYRKDQWTNLHRGGRLFQQYLVDEFTTIKEQRLSWKRNNQDTLRVDLYHNVVDAITRGDTNAACLGKRIILPISFTGGPRYMMQNYQDAMALCHAYGNPDLFITFTSNPKWPKITEMLAYIPGQRAHNRLEVGTRVFKLKLMELLDDLTKNHFFGVTRTVVYVIEFQKRGLPHAHILLWLEEYYRCKAATDIDDIISAELPSLATDQIGYKAVSGYMLHGPCGKDNRAAACNIEGKCSKHFPKPFYAETIIDRDGYPIYRQRDNKVFVKKEPKLWNSARYDIAGSASERRIVYSTPSAGERYFLRMLLNVVRAPQKFEHLMIVNDKICATFKEACFAYDLLNDNKEWTRAIQESSLWALGPQLRDLFVTILLFCAVSRPLKLWEENWEVLSDDILHKKRLLFST
ncbi:helicase [Tanacetum coccineum]